jgi:hypothetical protein
MGADWKFARVLLGMGQVDRDRVSDFKCHHRYGRHYVVAHKVRPTPVNGLNNLDCRFFARTSHIRIDRCNAALDYSRHEQPSLFPTPSPMTTVAFWSGSACRVVTNSRTFMVPTVVADGHIMASTTSGQRATAPAQVWLRPSSWKKPRWRE